MLTFRPLSLTFVALVFAIVHPAVSHPIQSLERATKDHFNGLLSRNSQRALEDDGDTLPSQSSATIHSQTSLTTEKQAWLPSHKYKRDQSSGKSIVSVLVPVSPSSAQSHESYHHVHSKTIIHKTGHYEDILDHPQSHKNKPNHHQTSKATFSIAHLKLAPGYTISLFSYRITIPLLQFGSSSSPQFQHPGIFTTVIVLLVMVWIAIFMIGLVEFGNHLWKRKRAAKLVVECEGERNGDDENGSEELVKLSRTAASGTLRDASFDEDAALLSSSSESEDGSVVERGEYRF